VYIILQDDQIKDNRKGGVCRIYRGDVNVKFSSENLKGWLEICTHRWEINIDIGVR
jgi:hypothetical protein